MKLDRWDLQEARVNALRELDILDTPAEPSFDAFIHLAAQLCNAPIALISLADEDRLWFKSEKGLGICEIPIAGTPCELVTIQSQPLVVPDLSEDDRFKTHPIVAGPPHLRFYAGTPLLTTTGLSIGTLCVVDSRARPGGLDAGQIEAMRALAGQIMAQLHMRRELRRREEEERHANNSRLASLINQVAVGIAQIDLDGHFTLVNDRYCAIIGRSREAAMACHCEEPTHPEDRHKNVELRARMLRTGEPVTLEKRILRPNGTIVNVKCHYSLLRDHAGNPSHAISIVQDITAERAAQDALWKLAESLEQRVATEVSQRLTVEDALRQIQKLDAVNSLGGGIAHDFNNMLTTMIGNLELLQNRLRDGNPAEAQRYLNGALASAERAGAVSRRMLAFSRREEPEPRPTEVTALVASMMLLVRHTVGVRITVITDLADQLAPVMCDPNQLENALLNLVINARDSITQDGTIAISTAAMTIRAEDSAAWGKVCAGDYVTLSVADTGVGMVTDVVARAFEPFFTTKPPGQGTGMGLYMLYNFARQAGGHVRVRSTPGEGTTVDVCLPCIATSAARSEAASASLLRQLIAAPRD